MTIFNINDFIEVELTDRGERILLNDETRAILYQPIKENSKIYRFQMWVFFGIFSKYMYNGAENIIEDNVILLDMDD